MAPNRDGETSQLSDADHLTALRARVQELEAREADRARSERVQAALYRIAEARIGRERPAGVLRRGPGDRRDADVRRELLHRALRRPAQGDQLPVLRRHASTSTSPTRTSGSRSASATPGARRPTCCGPARPRSSPGNATDELVGIGRDRDARRRRRGRLAGRAAQGRRRDDRRRRLPDLCRGRALHAGRPRAARLRRPAHRVGPDPRPGDRGDAPAERRAGARQRDRPGACGPARLPGHHRSRRRAGRGDLRAALHVHCALRCGDEYREFPVRHGRGASQRAGRHRARTRPHVRDHQHGSAGASRPRTRRPMPSGRSRPVARTRSRSSACRS